MSVRTSAHKTCSSDPRGYLPQQMNEEDLRGNWLAQYHLEKGPLNGINVSSSNIPFCRFLYRCDQWPVDSYIRSDLHTEREVWCYR